MVGTVMGSGGGVCSGDDTSAHPDETRPATAAASAALPTLPPSAKCYKW